MGNADKVLEKPIDVIIVGAGISGINAAYRIQTELPSASYTILESRGNIGGTWDFFRYPGFRSDSDLYTFGFEWRPWGELNAIADGESIRKYICESAALYGIDRKVQFHRKLTVPRAKSSAALPQQTTPHLHSNIKPSNQAGELQHLGYLFSSI